MMAHPHRIFRRPRCNLAPVKHAKIVQNLFVFRADAFDNLKVIAFAAFSRGNANRLCTGMASSRRHRCNRRLCNRRRRARSWRARGFCRHQARCRSCRNRRRRNFIARHHAFQPARQHTADDVGREKEQRRFQPEPNPARENCQPGKHQPDDKRHQRPLQPAGHPSGRLIARPRKPPDNQTHNQECNNPPK